MSHSPVETHEPIYSKKSLMGNRAYIVGVKQFYTDMRDHYFSMSYCQFQIKIPLQRWGGVTKQTSVTQHIE